MTAPAAGGSARDGASARGIATRLAYLPAVPLDPDELKRRLERAAELRLALRRATRELREMGKKALEARRDEPGRPDRRRPARG
jgi:hypothetical protein